MDLTPALASLMAQVISVLALAILVTYGSRRRAYLDAAAAELERRIQARMLLEARLGLRALDSEDYQPGDLEKVKYRVKAFSDGSDAIRDLMQIYLSSKWAKVTRPAEIVLAFVGIVNVLLFTLCLYVVGANKEIPSVGAASIVVSVAGLLGAAGYAVLPPVKKPILSDPRLLKQIDDAAISGIERRRAAPTVSKTAGQETSNSPENEN